MIDLAIAMNTQSAQEQTRMKKQQETGTAYDGFLGMLTEMLGTTGSLLDFLEATADSSSNSDPPKSPVGLEDTHGQMFNLQSTKNDFLTQNDPQLQASLQLPFNDTSEFISARNLDRQSSVNDLYFSPDDQYKEQQKNEQYLQSTRNGYVSSKMAVNFKAMTESAQGIQSQGIISEVHNLESGQNKADQDGLRLNIAVKEKAIEQKSISEPDNETVIPKGKRWLRDEIAQEVIVHRGGGFPGGGNAQKNEIVQLEARQIARDFPEIVITKLRTMANVDGTTELVVQLEPQKLGKLIVRLTSNEGMVSLKILAHAPVTKELLESGLNSLRQSFTEQGISFDKMDIELGGEQFNQHFFEHQHQQGLWHQTQQHGLQGTGHATNNYATDPEHFQTVPEERGQLLMGTYDYLV